MRHLQHKDIQDQGLQGPRRWGWHRHRQPQAGGEENEAQRVSSEWTLTFHTAKLCGLYHVIYLAIVRKHIIPPNPPGRPHVQYVRSMSSLPVWLSVAPMHQEVAGWIPRLGHMPGLLILLIPSPSFTEAYCMPSKADTWGKLNSGSLFKSWLRARIRTQESALRVCILFLFYFVCLYINLITILSPASEV